MYVYTFFGSSDNQKYMTAWTNIAEYYFEIRENTREFQYIAYYQVVRMLLIFINGWDLRQVVIVIGLIVTRSNTFITVNPLLCVTKNSSHYNARRNKHFSSTGTR